MTTTPKYPLSIMRGYKPEKVRYVWYILAKNSDGEETHHSGITHGGITNLTTRGGKDIVELKVSDLVRGKVYEITDVEGFMKEWGEEYFNYDWKVPMGLRK